MSMCMPALARQTFRDFELLIVDNGSTDGSPAYIEALEKTGLVCEPNSEAAGPASADRCSGDIGNKDNRSGCGVSDTVNCSDCGNAGNTVSCTPGSIPVRSILLSENTGFSGAVNVGIQAAAGAYVLLLNNDTEAAPDFIERLVAAMENGTANPARLFAVSPKMVQLYHKALLDDAGDGYNLLGWAFQRGVGQAVGTAKFNRRQPVFSACAGASLYRKALLETIRLSEGIYFDPLHFAYLEDLDVSYRARIHGYEVLYEPSAVIYHVGSGTSGSRYNSFKVRLAARNNLYLNYKNMPLLQLLLNLPGILLGCLIKQLFFLKKGFGRDYAAGFLEGLSTLKRCKKVRFRWAFLPSYIAIELRLIADSFSYLDDFLRRRLRRR